ncbi:MAG: M50 family metallopeptidase [Patescibacteria group bacterium]
MSVILLIVVLAVLVLSHEFGHFIVAKLGKIKVEEFGLGLPPKLIGRKWGGTIYSINWIPFGGFVRIFGEGGNGGEGSFVSKPKLLQAGVIIAGIVFNLILALALIWAGLQTGLVVSTSEFKNQNEFLVNQRVMITAVLPASPADNAGIKPGTSVNNFKSPDDVIRYVKAHNKQEVVLETDKGEYKLIPDPLMGIEMDLVADAHMNFFGSIVPGLKVTWRLTTATASGLFQFITNIFRGQASFEGVVGPVGIAGIIGQASEQGFSSLLLITAILSLSLAVINLVPFPALDGGRLLFVIIEAIKGSPIKERVARIMNTIGFSILILLMIIITYRDIAHLLT